MTEQKTEQQKADELKNELDMFNGTEQWHRHIKLIYTDGIKHLIEKAQAHWLLDIIESYQYKLKNKLFQIWNLTVNKEDQTAVIIMKEDKNEKPVIKQKISFTDFLLDEIEFYCIDGVILLKSEY